MAELRCRAVVLRVRNWKEADKLVTLLTREAGKVTAVARGTKKVNSRFSAVVEPLTLGHFLLHRGKTFETLIQGEIINSYDSLRRDLLRMAYAQYFCELCDAALPEKEPSAELFDLLLTAFEALEDDETPVRVARCFEVSLLDTLGFRPSLESCIHCGGGEKPFRFDPAEGGIVCGACNASPGSFPVSAGALAVTKRFLQDGFYRLSVCTLQQPLAEEIGRLCSAMFQHNLGVSGFKTLAVLKSLEKE